MFCDGPVQSTVCEDLVRWIVCSVVLEGSPPPVCWANSHQEKVSGRTAVPRLGPPQATVAVAETAVASWPITGANQCSCGVRPETVTRLGFDARTGGGPGGVPRIGAAHAPGGALRSGEAR